MDKVSTRNLSYIGMVHYRKLFFSAMIVLVSDLSSIQIQVIMQLSLLMIILITSFQPYTSGSSNIQDVKDEVIVMVVCYHLILISDFVPLFQL